MVKHDPAAGAGSQAGPWLYGEIAIERVLDFDGPGLDPFVLLPDLTQDILDRHRHWLEPGLLDKATGRLVSSFHSFIVRTPRTITVVDTCGGNDKHRPNRPRYHMARNPYLERLAATGVRPEDVDFVLCTHMHGDHVGWNTRLVEGKWVPTFPKARYLISRIEWNYWVDAANRRAYNEDLYFEDSILPVLESGQIVLIDDGYAVDKGVTVEATPGHTPGHLCVRIACGAQQAVMSGDLMHNALQIAEPSLNSCFCVNSEQARRMRRQFLERCLDAGTLVMPAHFPAPTAGRVVQGGAGTLGFAFEKTFDASRPGENRRVK
ncbi:MAG: MBL fold metallo-hydrolase [Betaproteobacteria bacterium]|nr:MBL fold metallo-hydrolase [Betaproteobacteria bacterium]